MKENELITILQNPEIDSQKKYELIDEFFSLDDEGKFKYLEFTDPNGNKCNLIGKKKTDLIIDEVVACKQFSNHLYDIIYENSTEE